jgi:hypothetical protein
MVLYGHNYCTTGGNLIKTFTLVLFTFIILLSASHDTHAEETPKITRNILTNIGYDDYNSVIRVHYLQIQQEQGKEPLVDTDFIKKLYLDKDDVSDITVDNVTGKVMKDRSNYADVFIEDEIIGKEAYIFADERGNKLSNTQVDQYVKEVKAQNEKDFKNPPSQKELDNIIDKKMKKDGFEPIEPMTKHFFIDFILRIIFLIIGLGIVKAVINRIREHVSSKA